MKYFAVMQSRKHQIKQNMGSFDALHEGLHRMWEDALAENASDAKRSVSFL